MLDGPTGGGAAAESQCPRCGGSFHCGVNDAQPCACSTLKLDAETLAALRERYSTCLCRRCLGELQKAQPVGRAERG